MTPTEHFDRRGTEYDTDQVHQRIVELLLDGVDLRPGFRVLDVATGTGAVALKVAERVGASGEVTGIDVSSGMLVEARRKASAAGLQNVVFLEENAERIDWRSEQYDVIVCASGLILMADIPAALRRWYKLLKSGGAFACDMPAKPFGISQQAAEAAARHNIEFAYNSVADTSEKCRSFLESAGFRSIAIKPEMVNDQPVKLTDAVEFWDTHQDHPAWAPLQNALQLTRNAVRADYIRSVTLEARNGFVDNTMTLNLAFARK